MRRAVILVSFLSIFILALSSALVFASPDAPTFQTRWGVGQNSVPFGMGTDSAGNVYLAGTANMSKPPDYIGANGTIFLLKLDSHGSLIWQRSWTESTGLAQEYGGLVAVDSQGNTFLAATTPVPRSNPCEGTYSLPGILLLKFDAQGVLIWQKTFAGYCRLQAFQMVLSSKGNLFLTGLSWEQLTPSQYRSGGPFVMKLDSSGDLLWAKHINATCICTSSGVTVDQFENAIMTGNLVAKFNSTGSALWEENLFTQISNNTATYLSGASVSTDTSGNIYETGNGLIVKLAPSGVVIWAREWDSAAITQEVQVDNSSNVFVTGSIPNGNTPVGYNTFLIKLDSAGNLLGQTVWEGTTTTVDYTSKVLALDSNGRVFVAGVVSGSAIPNSHYASNVVKNATVYAGSCDSHLGCGLFPTLPATARCACNLWLAPPVQPENILAGQTSGTAANLNGQINPGAQNNAFLLQYDANQLNLSPNDYLIPIVLGGTAATAIVLSTTFLWLRRRKRNSHRVLTQTPNPGAV